MRQRLAPLLFDDEDRAEAEALRDSIVAPAEVSPSAQAKAGTRRTPDGLPVQSFQTLLQALATVQKCQVRIRSAPKTDLRLALEKKIRLVVLKLTPTQ